MRSLLAVPLLLVGVAYAAVIGGSGEPAGTLATNVSGTNATFSTQVLVGTGAGISTFTATALSLDDGLLLSATSATVTGRFTIPTLALAAILARTPDGAGEMFRCSDCAASSVCVSTGTGAGAYVEVSSNTSVCN